MEDRITMLPMQLIALMKTMNNGSQKTGESDVRSQLRKDRLRRLATLRDADISSIEKVADFLMEAEACKTGDSFDTPMRIVESKAATPALKTFANDMVDVDPGQGGWKKLCAQILQHCFNGTAARASDTAWRNQERQAATGEDVAMYGRRMSSSLKRHRWVVLACGRSADRDWMADRLTTVMEGLLLTSARVASCDARDLTELLRIAEKCERAELAGAVTQTPGKRSLNHLDTRPSKRKTDTRRDQYDHATERIDEQLGNATDAIDVLGADIKQAIATKIEADNGILPQLLAALQRTHQDHAYVPGPIFPTPSAGHDAELGLCPKYIEGVPCNPLLCALSHATPPASLPPTGDCFSYTRNGSCRNGDLCSYKHTPGATTPSPATQPANTQAASRECFEWRNDKNCRFGDTCRFEHDGKPVGREGPRYGSGGSGECFDWKRGRCARAHCKFRHVGSDSQSHDGPRRYNNDDKYNNSGRGNSNGERHGRNNHGDKRNNDDSERKRQAQRDGKDLAAGKKREEDMSNQIKSLTALLKSKSSGNGGNEM
jgi:hypothetical protein